MTNQSEDEFVPDQEIDKSDSPEDPSGVPKELAQFAQLVLEQYQGQFPHPEHMERYAALDPRSPTMIFNQFELQSAHRREMESIYARGNETRAGRGQWLAFSLAGTAIIGGIIAILMGQAAAGATIISVTFGGGVVLYIAGGGAKRATPARQVKQNQRRKASARTGSIEVPPVPEGSP